MKSALFVLACVAVVALYAGAAQSGLLEWSAPTASDTDYNLLVRAFRAGQLSLPLPVPAGLGQLADPYDPTANAPYRSLAHRLHDLSYYRGRLYLYFGIGPALVLFWPWAALTGRYLWHREAAAIFCAAGFLVSAGLLRALWRRYFQEVPAAVVAAAALALGLAGGAPVLLARAEVYEVAISCGQMAALLALAAVWCALHAAAGRREAWLAAASAADGLARAARPSLLFGAVILLGPILGGSQAPAERAPLVRLLRLGAAAFVPLGLCGLGLLLYNGLRFGHPLEFGQHYQLAGDLRQDTQRHFSLGYLPFNLRVYFLESVRWTRHFPFVGRTPISPLPVGHGAVEKPFGVLTDLPLVWLTLAAPLAWRNRPASEVSVLRCFSGCAAALFGLNALTLGLYYYVSSRFEMEFLPELLLLATVGILGVERALAGQPACRRLLRWVWGPLLAWSVVFNLCAAIEHHAEALYDYGIELLQVNRTPEAIDADERALSLKPDFPEAHNNLGLALARAGRASEAMAQYEAAVRLDPELGQAHYNWGIALFQAGRLQEAAEQYGEAVRLEPAAADARYDLGSALLLLRRPQEAVIQLQAALRLSPDFAEAHSNLGSALLQLGRPREAALQLAEALRLDPNLASARHNLALAREGRSQGNHP